MVAEDSLQGEEAIVGPELMDGDGAVPSGCRGRFFPGRSRIGEGAGSAFAVGEDGYRRIATVPGLATQTQLRPSPLAR